MNDGGPNFYNGRNPNNGQIPQNGNFASTPRTQKPDAPVAHIFGQEISGIVDIPSSAPTNLKDNGPLIAAQHVYVAPQPQPQPPQPTPAKKAASSGTNSPKKSKKSLIFTSLGIFFLLVATAAAVFAYLSANQPAPQPTPAYQTAFNTFANDLIYGTPSSDPISNPPSADQFYYHQKLTDPNSSSESDPEYLNRLSQEFNTFLTNLPSTSDAYSDATNYQQLLNFIKLNPGGETYSRNTLISHYIEGGETSASDYLLKTINSLPQNNPYASEFITLKQNQFAATLDYLLFLDADGCIDFDAKIINSACAATLDQNMQDDPERYYYHEQISDEPLSYFQTNFSENDVGSNPDANSDANPATNPSTDSGTTQATNQTNKQDDNQDTEQKRTRVLNAVPSLEYQTPYSVMHQYTDLVNALLNTDYNRLGENLLTLQNLLK